MRETKIKCTICGHAGLAIDFFECPICGYRNPQVHLLKRTQRTLWIADEVLRPLEKIAIRKGRPVDDLVIEAIEEWLSKTTKK